MSDHRDIKELTIKENGIGRLAKFFVNRFQITLLVIIIIVFVGVSGVTGLPKESLPEIVFPTVIVRTAFPGAGPQDVERLVSEKIENKVAQIDDVSEYTSNSEMGFSVVTIAFDSGVDIERKRIEVQSEIDEIRFEGGVLTPEINVFTTSDIPLMSLSISGDYSVEQLSEIAELLQTELEKIDGIVEAQIVGQVEKEVHIYVNQSMMMGYGITPEAIRQVLSDFNSGLPVAEMTLGDVRYAIRMDEGLEDLEAIENTLIQTKDGNSIQLKDLAEIRLATEEIGQLNRTYENGGASYTSVSLNVIREDRSDVIGLSSKVRKLLENSRGSLYPDDLKILIENDLAITVAEDLSNIQESALSGLIVVIIVLFLFIGLKESLIVSITIPLSLLLTLGMLSIFDITLNTFAILGLIVALGLLVDNSIIVMENIDRLYLMGLTGKEAALKGLNQVAFPILASTLTTLAAFFPLAILPGTLGDFVETIPRTIMIALLASLIISIVITPSVYAKISSLKKRGFDKKISVKIVLVLLIIFLSYYAFGGGLLSIIASTFFGIWIIIKLFGKKREANRGLEIYKRVLLRIIEKTRFKIIVLISGLAVLVSSFGLIATGLLEIAFFPENIPSSAVVSIDAPGGTPLEKTLDIVGELEDYLSELEGIKSYTVTAGGISSDVASIVIDLEIESSKEVLENIRNAAKRVSGAEILVEGESAGGPPVAKPVELILTGDDLGSLRQASDLTKNALSEIAGVFNISSTLAEGSPEILIDINEDKLSIFDLTVSSINSQLRSLLDGTEVTTMKIGGEELPVVVKFNTENIQSIEQLSSLYLVNSKGEPIPILAIANFIEKKGVNSIRREDGTRIVTVSADLSDDVSIASFKSGFDMQLAIMDYPEGIVAKYGGDVAGIEENFINLFKSMGLAILLVFMILSLQFNSLRQPFVILSTVPMALIGVLLGLFITGNAFGFYAFMGLVALVGIAVNDAIVLIDYMNYLRSEGYSIKEAIVEAGVTRFGPVLATTLTTIGGVLPLALKDVYYAEFGFTLVFGLLVTTILTLVYIPIMYSIFEKNA